MTVSLYWKTSTMVSYQERRGKKWDWAVCHWTLRNSEVWTSQYTGIISQINGYYLLTIFNTLQILSVCIISILLLSHCCRLQDSRDHFGGSLAEMTSILLSTGDKFGLLDQCNFQQLFNTGNEWEEAKRLLVRKVSGYFTNMHDYFILTLVFTHVIFYFMQREFFHTPGRRTWKS